MIENFLSIKQGGYPFRGSLPGNSVQLPVINPPRFFFSTPKVPVMSDHPKYNTVPFLQEKLKHTKKLIKIFQDNITTWEASEPDYPLLARVKDQLQKNSQMLQEITVGLPCQ